MKKNMGTLDKAVRVLVAVLIGILYFANLITGLWAIVLLVIAGIFLVTSFVSFCPIYTILGISTQKKEQKT